MLNIINKLKNITFITDSMYTYAFLRVDALHYTYNI